MYPKFIEILKTLVAADTKGLWQRWLRSTPAGCSYVQVDLLFQARQELYLSCLLIMYLAPDDDFLREHTPWVFSSENTRYCSWFRFDDKVCKTRLWSELLSAFERIVSALMDDLEVLPYLSETDVGAWARCERVITDILIHRSIDDPTAMKLFDRLRFYEVPSGDSAPYETFLCVMSIDGYRDVDCVDPRWKELAFAKMKQLVLQESQGVVLQPAVSIPFGAQYLISFDFDVEEMIRNQGKVYQPRKLVLDFEAEVQFAAQLGLFAKHSYQAYIVQMIGVVRTAQTRQALLLNLIELRDQSKWLIEDAELCEWLRMAIKEMRRTLTKEQYAQLSLIYKGAVDHVKQVQRAERELKKVERPEDVVKAMRRRKR